jgi:hypothetical protein
LNTSANYLSVRASIRALNQKGFLKTVPTASVRIPFAMSDSDFVAGPRIPRNSCNLPGNDRLRRAASALTAQFQEEVLS